MNAIYLGIFTFLLGSRCFIYVKCHYSPALHEHLRSHVHRSIHTPLAPSHTHDYLSSIFVQQEVWKKERQGAELGRVRGCSDTHDETKTQC